jgi:imidazolonepropionase
VQDGKIVAVGGSTAILAQYAAGQKFDATGKVVCPGFVDCHTHAVYGGDRVHEFELRIQGASYMEIMAAGGGIVSTVRHTRDATLEQLVRSASARLDQMLALGTTTAEIKSGYGLETTGELKMLHAIAQLDAQHPLDLVPTFLGAHTTPAEYRGNPAGYVELVIGEMLPRVAEWYQGSHFLPQQVPLFCDVFTEDHAFDVAQSEQILRAAQDAGLPSKIHVDQFNSLGGLPMAIGLGSVSADHLEVTTADDIQRLGAADTMAVLLPAVNFNLGLVNFAPGRALADAGAPIALATDLNPGSAPCFSMPLVMAIATRYLNLLPAEALNAATINAAHAIGLEDRVGSLEVGKQADLLIVDAPDYRHLMYLLGGDPVQTVIKGGQIVASGTKGL